MTDKIQKIRKEFKRLREQLQNKVEESDFISVEVFIINYFLTFIDSLQEEPVSEGLEKAAVEAFKNIVDSDKNSFLEIFKAGAEWQKNKMMQNTIDAHCFGFQGAALFSFRLPADNYLVGSEVKVIVIKED